MHEPFRATNRFRQQMAQGHEMRTGHTLRGYYTEHETPGVVQLVRTCCGEKRGCGCGAFAWLPDGPTSGHSFEGCLTFH